MHRNLWQLLPNIKSDFGPATEAVTRSATAMRIADARHCSCHGHANTLIIPHA